MSEHQLEVILKMRDEASKKIEQFSQKVENEMKKAGESMVSFGRQISKIGKDMTIIGGAITGPLALAFKTTSDYSIEASETLKRLDDSAKAFQITIGNALLPVVEKVSNVIAALTKWFEQLDPKMRDSILQGALMTGILLTLGGALTYIIGKVIDLGGRLLLFAKAHPVLLLISAALIFMIMNWQKVREVAIPVLNAIEIGAEMVAIGFQTIVKFMADAMVGVVGNLEKVLYYLSMIPGPQQKVFEAMRAGAEQTKGFFQTVSEAASATINDLQQDMANTMESGKGHVASFVDEGIIKIQTLMDFFNNNMVPGIDAAMQNFSQNFSKVWTQAYEQAVNLGQQSAQIFVNSIQQLSTGIGTAVSDMIFKGKNFGESMKQVALQMAQTFISSIVSMIAQFLIFQAVQAAFFPLIVATGAAAAGALSAIWAGPAALVSLATMGANAGPAAAAIIGTVALAHASAIPMAEGGSGMVNRPTLFLAGEAGPERFSFTPTNRINNLSRSGNGTNIINHFNFDNITIRDETDIETLAAEIDRRIARGTSR